MLPRIMLLFETISVLKNDAPFKQCQKKIYPNLCGGEKTKG